MQAFITSAIYGLFGKLHIRINTHNSDVSLEGRHVHKGSAGCFHPVLTTGLEQSGDDSRTCGIVGTNHFSICYNFEHSRFQSGRVMSQLEYIDTVSASS